MRLNERPALMYTAALLIAFSLTGPAAAQTRSDQTRANVSVADVSKIRIDNFGRINPNYYRGAQPTGRDYADLAAIGVRTLVDLTSDDSEANENAMVQNAGMTYFRIPMTTHDVPTAAKLAAFLKIVNDPANQPVYVHCVGGRHRTGVMTAVYRMNQDGWTADQAFREMKQYKFGADFLHPEFKDFVYSYRADARTTPVNATVAATKTIGY